MRLNALIQGFREYVNKFKGYKSINSSNPPPTSIKSPLSKAKEGFFVSRPTPACEAEGLKQKRPKSAESAGGFCCKAPPHCGSGK